MKVRQIAAYNPRVAYFRDIVRPRILKTPPLTDTKDASAEVHVLTSNRDWINTVWALKSFYSYVDTRYSLCIHGDPHLSAEAVEGLRAQFPDARIILQSEIREEILDSLSAYPRCRQLRETNTLSIKAFDFAHTQTADKMILFDSDLLFFARPVDFLLYLDAGSPRVNTFNRDVSTAYSVDVTQINASGFSVAEEINSGFGVVHRGSMRLDWMEEFLKIPGLASGHFWRIEQTLFALCSSRFGVELLPNDYRVFLRGEIGNRPFRHYVGAIRERMYTEGMSKLKKRLLFNPTCTF